MALAILAARQFERVCTYVDVYEHTYEYILYIDWTASRLAGVGRALIQQIMQGNVCNNLGHHHNNNKQR